MLVDLTYIYNMELMYLNATSSVMGREVKSEVLETLGAFLKRNVKVVDLVLLDKFIEYLNKVVVDNAEDLYGDGAIETSIALDVLEAIDNYLDKGEQ